MAILFLCAASTAQERRDSVIVSLITCWPGADIYELCGHEAIRVRGEGIDSVWNYGMFSFNQPNFVYRFVKGETDYMLGAYPFDHFMPEYILAGRKVVEQDLNLTADESQRLLAMLRTEARPENRTYRYNYVRDNCATRIVDRLDQATVDSIYYPDSLKYGTFRREMRAFHHDYPWYQFGIDLALGSGLDVPLKGRQEMFVPIEMMERAAGAKFADGRPLVTETRVLNQGLDNATLPPTPWYLTPLFASLIILLITIGLSAWMLKVRKVFPLVYTIWFGICGLAGCIIAFLVFCSEHDSTSPNILMLWLNPLQFVVAIWAWVKGKGKWPATVMAWYNIIVVGVLLLVWPFQAQSANPAFFALMGTTWLLATVYAINAPHQIKINKSTSQRRTAKYEQNSTIGTRRPRSNSSGGTRRNRQTASGGGYRR